MTRLTRGPLPCRREVAIASRTARTLGRKVTVDRGAASIFVLGVGLFLVAAGLAGAAVGSARVAGHEARNAADLGALAGAGRVLEGEEVACAEAARYASANGARMITCTVSGLEIVIRVGVAVNPLPGMSGIAEESARAGPVSAL